MLRCGCRSITKPPNFVNFSKFEGTKAEFQSYSIYFLPPFGLKQRTGIAHDGWKHFIMCLEWYKYHKLFIIINHLVSIP